MKDFETIMTIREHQFKLRDWIVEVSEINYSAFRRYLKVSGIEINKEAEQLFCDRFESGFGELTAIKFPLSHLIGVMHRLIDNIENQYDQNITENLRSAIPFGVLHILPEKNYLAVENSGLGASVSQMHAIEMIKRSH